MLIRSILFVIFTFFIADYAFASTIRTFSYATVSVNKVKDFAQNKVNTLGTSRQIYRGNIVYVAVKQNIGPNAYFRFDDAGGKWIHSTITATEYGIGLIQEKIIQELVIAQQNSFFIAVHGGSRGFDIVGGGRIVVPWGCTKCRVTITDIGKELESLSIIY